MTCNVLVYINDANQLYIYSRKAFQSTKKTTIYHKQDVVVVSILPQCGNLFSFGFPARGLARKRVNNDKQAAADDAMDILLVFFFMALEKDTAINFNSLGGGWH